MTKKFVVSVLAVVASIVAAPSFAAPPVAPAAQGNAAKGASVTIDVEGVRCAGCTVAIRREVKKLDGIRCVRSGESVKQLIIDYDKSKVSTKEILEAVKKAGFEARVHRGK